MKEYNIFVLLIVAALLAGCSTPQPEPVPQAVQQINQLMETANSASIAGNWTASENTWGEIAKKSALLDRRDLQAIALHNQAYAAYKQNHFDVSLQLATEAAEINKQGEQWWKNQILLLQIEKRLSPEDRTARLSFLDQIEKRDDLIHVFPHIYVLLQNEKGIDLLKEQEIEQAKAVFDTALLNAKESTLVLAIKSNLALCAEEEHDYEKAFELWNEILSQAKDITNPEMIAISLHGAGRCCWKQGRTSDAVILLRRAASNYKWQNMDDEYLKTLNSLKACFSELKNESAVKEIDKELEQLAESKR